MFYGKDSNVKFMLSNNFSKADFDFEYSFGRGAYGYIAHPRLVAGAVHRRAIYRPEW